MATPAFSSSSKRDTVWGIVVGGGSGSRFGASTPKQFLPLGDRLVIEWSIEAFCNADCIDRLIVVIPPETINEYEKKWYRYEPKLFAVVAGGQTRFESVSNALAALPPDAEYVMIHDAARPGVQVDLIDTVFNAMKMFGAALPVLEIPSTVKRVEGGIIRNTIDRKQLRLAQTPQGFRLDLLQAGIKDAGDWAKEATDEIQLVEQLPGVTVNTVPGSSLNEKITVNQDFSSVVAMLTSSTSSSTAELLTGIGYDVHQFAEGRPLVIGGIKFDSPIGLLGHSDADVLTHAIADAILGAASMGDIGTHFPDSDPTWKDADSIVLLRHVAKIIEKFGYMVSHIDSTLIMESPKVMPRREDMCNRIATALGIGANQVSIKATTNEGIGFIGRKEGAAAIAIATVKRGHRG